MKNRQVLGPRMPALRGRRRAAFSSPMRRAVLCVLSAAATAPTAWHCESWCNHYTCKNEACADCRTEHGCGPGHEIQPPTPAAAKDVGLSSCASWCDEKTCAAKECSACENSKCTPDLPGCASWCSDSHCGIADCSACDNPKCELKTGAPAIEGCAGWCNENTYVRKGRMRTQRPE